MDFVWFSYDPLIFSYSFHRFYDDFLIVFVLKSYDVGWIIGNRNMLP